MRTILFSFFPADKFDASTSVGRDLPPDNSRHADEISRHDEISRLLENAPADSIRQSINVQREEEEIVGAPPASDGGAPERMLNVDMVSEKVDLGLKDGVAQVTVRVRCERVVPIRGSGDMFKKSSVVVTRLIEIDLNATEERRRLYQRVLRGSAFLTTRGQDYDGAGAGAGVGLETKLNTRDTFDLYKTLMAMADAEDARNVHQRRLQIDRELDEQRIPAFRSPAGPLLDDDDDDDEDFDFGQPPEFDPEQLENRLEERIRPHGTSSHHNQGRGVGLAGGRGGVRWEKGGQMQTSESASGFLY